MPNRRLFFRYLPESIFIFRSRRQPPLLTWITIGTRENLIATHYNYNFGVFNKDNNNPGRIIQLAIKIFW